MTHADHATACVRTQVTSHDASRSSNVNCGSFDEVLEHGARATAIYANTNARVFGYWGLNDAPG